MKRRFRLRLMVRCALLVVGAALLAGEPPREYRVTLAESVVMPFVWIAPGRYWRGSESTEIGRDRDEGPRHEVTLTRGFFLGVYEVTQAQWQAVMGVNPAVFKRGPDAPLRPVESVSWEDGQRFIAKLGALGLGKFRLPTEAEWEFAARAGTTTRYPWGDDLKEVETHAHAWANSRSYERDLGNRWHFFLDNRWGWAAGAVGLGNYSDFVCGILA